ncbi:SagB/ThcOx family dehydrogenase [Chloroflexota bacterium]
MKGYCLAMMVIFSLVLSACTVAAPPFEEGTTVKLPEPWYDSEVSLEQSLLERRSTRSYTGESLALQDVSQLLWAAQGITDDRGLRTAPSAGGLYPLEVYVVAGDVKDLAPGVYKYGPDRHELIPIAAGDCRSELADAALGQSWVKEGAIVIVFAAVYERTTGKYGERGISYVHIELGHAAQNLCLQATAMGLGVVTVGAFHDEQVVRLLNMPGDEQPLYVIPVGRK